MYLKNLLILALVLLVFGADAQEEGIPSRRFGATIVAGFNASQIDGDESAGFNKVGINTGLRSDIFLTTKTELNIGVLFSQRGSRPDSKELFLDEFIFGLNYIQVPVLFSYKDWYQDDGNFHRVRAFGGLSYGRLVGTKLDQTGFDFRPEALEKNSVGFHFGIGYNFNKNLRVTTEYMRDLIPLYNVRNKEMPVVTRSQLVKTINFKLEYSL